MSDVPDLAPTILADIRDQIQQTNARLDNMIGMVGALMREHEDWLRDHDVRIRRVERRGRRSPHGPRRRT